MAIYAIGDLHLSGDSDKPMDIFGEHWADHGDKIKASWLEKVKKDDAVPVSYTHLTLPTKSIV